jgi:hypothetical protein
MQTFLDSKKLAFDKDLSDAFRTAEGEIKVPSENGITSRRSEELLSVS